MRATASGTRSLRSRTLIRLMDCPFSKAPSGLGPVPGTGIAD
jgi:hypothetical protein